MTHSDFLAKTFVAQCKGYKRFRIEGMYYFALDTLNHAYNGKIITRSEWNEAYEYFQNFIYERGAIVMYAIYSTTFHGWVIYERRQIGNHVVDVIISTPYPSEELAIDAMHTIYAMRQAMK